MNHRHGFDETTATSARPPADGNTSGSLPPAAAVTPWSAAGLAAILLLAVLLRLALFVGCIGSDDLRIWEVGHALSEGNWDIEQLMGRSVATMRYGITLPVAVVIALAGSSEWKVMLYPLAMSLLGIVAAWDVTRRLSGRVWAAHLSAVMIALCGLDIYTGTVLLPDGPMCTIGLLVLWCLVWMSQGQPEGKLAGTVCFAAGLLLSFAWMHKTAAAQFGLAIAIWGAILLWRRELRPALLFLGLGFGVGFAGELALIGKIYRDPMARFQTITDDHIAVHAYYREHAPQRADLVDKLKRWEHNLRSDHPATAILVLLGLPLAGWALWTRWSDPSIRLLGLWMVALAVMRAAELVPTFSIQPRRLLPLFHVSAVLLPLWLVTRQGRRASAFAATAALGVVFLFCFSTKEADYLRSAGSKLSNERWIARWIHEHDALVRDNRLHVDTRTAQILHVLLSFDDLAERGIYLMPQNNSDSGRPIAGRFGQGITPAMVANNYSPGAFFYDNTRILNWLFPGQHDWSHMRWWTNMPPEWVPLEVVPNRVSPRYNAALFRLPAQAAGHSPDPAERTDTKVDSQPFVRAASSVRHSNGQLLSLGPPRIPLSLLEAGPATTPSTSAASGDDVVVQATAHSIADGQSVVYEIAAERTDSDRPVLRKGDGVVFEVPVGAGHNQMPDGWGEVEYYVRVWDRRKNVETLQRNRRRVYYDRQVFRAYAVAPTDIVALRLVVRPRRPDTYSFGTPRLRRLKGNSMPIDLHERSESQERKGPSEMHGRRARVAGEPDESARK